MTSLEWTIIIAAGAVAWIIGTALDRANKHLSNIADRLLDIENVLKNRR